MNDHNDPYTSIWLTFISICSYEELLRWRKRATLRLPESPARYDLITALETELMPRDLLDQIVVPPLKP
jgi:hypothetical protein